MSIVDNVYNDFIHLGYLENTPSFCEKNQRFYGRLKKIVMKMSEILGLSLQGLKPISIELDENPFEIIPMADVRNRCITIPVLPCLDFEDALEESVISDPTDSRLDSPSNTQQFADWIIHRFNLNAQGLSGTVKKKYKVSLVDAHKLRLFLKGIQDKEGAAKGFKFSLGHELGHIYYQHQFKETTLFKVVSISNFCLGSLWKIYKERLHEKQADAFSYTSSEELAEGGIYLFTILGEGDTSCLPFKEKVITALQNLSLFVTHSSSASRKKAIINHLSRS